MYKVFLGESGQSGFAEVGVGLRGKHLDVRVSYWNVVGSANVEEMLAVSLGLGF